MKRAFTPAYLHFQAMSLIISATTHVSAFTRYRLWHNTSILWPILKHVYSFLHSSASFQRARRNYSPLRKEERIAVCRQRISISKIFGGFFFHLFLSIWKYNWWRPYRESFIIGRKRVGEKKHPSMPLIAYKYMVSVLAISLQDF